MKKIGLVFSLVLLLSFSFQVSAQWFWQNPLPQGNTLWSVKFVDVNTGWLVGSCGTILQTINGGSSWALQTSGTGKLLLDVSFSDVYNGIVVGGYGTICGLQTEA